MTDARGARSVVNHSGKTIKEGINKPGSEKRGLFQPLDRIHNKALCNRKLTPQYADYNSILSNANCPIRFFSDVNVTMRKLVGLHHATTIKFT